MKTPEQIAKAKELKAKECENLNSFLKQRKVRFGP
jgi:hypothetical protein